MRKNQKIVVHTKGGLIAACSCAENHYPGTEIILVRKTGELKILLYDLTPAMIRKLKTKIRKLPAKQLLS